jgi:hypothetical protein
MLPTFETVLEQARALPAADRKRLAAILNEPNGGKISARGKWDDDPVIAALRAWVDKIESSSDPDVRASIEIAERIREWNDRGYKL